MAQRFQFVCRFIKILYFPSSSDTTVYRLPPQLLYLSSTLCLEQRRSDTIDEKNVTLIYDYGFEVLFSERIRR